MDALVLLVLYMLLISALSSSSETREPAPSVVVMASPPQRSRSITGDVFMLSLLVIFLLWAMTQ
ncbi:MAG TPA: hypothetical protein VIK33_02115 [Anaerolineae bacterium]